MWARGARRIIEFAVSQGAPRRGLLEASALAEVDLEDPDARVPLVLVYDLVEYAVHATADERFGIHFALGIEVPDLDALGFLMMTSATVGEAMERAVRYMRLWNDGERYSLSVEGGVARIAFMPYGPDRPAHRQMAEMAVTDMVANGRRMAGAGLEVTQVRFGYPAPADTSELTRLLEAPIEFDAPVTEVLLPQASLALPLPDANAMLCGFFERYASSMLERLPAASAVADRVRQLVGAELSRGDPSLEALAARLHMSPRTLQRRLREEGTSLHEQVERVRRERAAAFLDNGMAIAEIAWLLGYADPSVFHRAFKRWTGRTPEAWRAEQRLAQRAMRPDE
jgi:AraC-like DNA-binding protein